MSVVLAAAGSDGEASSLRIAAFAGRTLGDEHELAAWAVRRFPHIQHPVARGDQACFQFVAAAEPQGRLRGNHRAVRPELVGVTEGDERKAHAGDLAASLY